jgi:polysaccharide export outer membrane protein
MTHRFPLALAAAVFVFAMPIGFLAAQGPAPSPAPKTKGGSPSTASAAPTGSSAKGTAPAKAAAAAPTVAPPPGYVIGADDVLTVVFWRDKDLSGDVIVRPDGNISLPLINDVQAAGRTPEELRVALVEAAGRYIEDPNATIVVKQINSRKVFATGNVMKPGPYPLTMPTSVLQLISMAGGLKEFADERNIVVIRTENGQQFSYRVNYRDVVRRRNLKQNILLKSGDTVVVP